MACYCVNKIPYFKIKAYNFITIEFAVKILTRF